MAFLKPIFVMSNFKRISIAFSVMALLFFVSCDTEETNKTDSDNSIELNELDATSVQKRPEGEMVYRSVSYNDGNKEAVLSELIESFTEYLYVDLGFDSQKEIVLFDIEKNLKNQKYILKYEVLRLDPLVLGLALGLSGGEYDILESDKEQLELYCNGGDEDGTSIIVDRPTGRFSAIKFAIAIESFANACLDGGGCIETCKVTAVISNIVQKTSDPNVTE